MSKLITEFLDKQSEKRVLSDDGTTGVSPEAKRSNQDPEITVEDEETVFNPPEDAPRWVVMMMASMRKLYQRFDKYKLDTDAQLESIRERSTVTVRTKRP